MGIKLDKRGISKALERCIDTYACCLDEFFRSLVMLVSMLARSRMGWQSKNQVNRLC